MSKDLAISTAAQVMLPHVCWCLMVAFARVFSVDLMILAMFAPYVLDISVRFHHSMTASAPSRTALASRKPRHGLAVARSWILKPVAT